MQGARGGGEKWSGSLRQRMERAGGSGRALPALIRSLDLLLGGKGGHGGRRAKQWYNLLRVLKGLQFTTIYKSRLKNQIYSVYHGNYIQYLFNNF